MLGGTGTHTINLNGLQVNIDWFEIYSTGTYVLASDFTGGSTFFRMVRGSFLSNNYTITCGYFDLRCVNGTTADLGTSKVYCDYATLGSNYASSTFNTSNAEFVVKTNLDFAQSGISVKSVLFTGDFASLYA